MIIFYCVSFILLTSGLYMIASEKFQIPSLASSMAVSNMTKQSGKPSKIDLWINDLSVRLASHIKLNEYRRAQLEADLHSAGIETSPELFTSTALMKTAVILIFAIPLGVISPMLILVDFAVAVYIYLDAAERVREKIREKRKNIEYELPAFVSFVEKSLLHSRDVLSMLDNYKSSAGEALKHELNITVSDMRTGNQQTALLRLESRIGSTMMSDVTRGLAGILRGDDTLVYWQELGIKFADWQRQLLKQQANKVPGKVKKLIMVLLFCFTATYFVVLGMEIVQNLGGML